MNLQAGITSSICPKDCGYPEVIPTQDQGKKPSSIIISSQCISADCIFQPSQKCIQDTHTSSLLKYASQAAFLYISAAPRRCADVSMPRPTMMISEPRLPITSCGLLYCWPRLSPAKTKRLLFNTI